MVAMSGHLSPSVPTLVSLTERLGILLGHVERVVAEGTFYGSGMALAQMFSHFDEIDPFVITEGYAASHNDEDLDRIEDQLYRLAQLMAGGVDLALLM